MENHGIMRWLENPRLGRPLFTCGLLAALLLAVLPAGAATRSTVVTNGAFESGASGWAQQGSMGALISPYFPHDGAQGAYLADYNNAEDRLAQTIALPGDAGPLTLTFWWAMTTEESYGALDTLNVSLYKPDGAPLASLATYDASGSANIWNEVSLDLTSYAGQTVQLRFTAHTDGVARTAFFVDDVSVNGQSAATQGNALYLPFSVRAEQ